MPSHATWTGDDPVATDVPATTSDTLGRTTVLPRVADDGPEVVQRGSGPRFDELTELGRGGLGVVLQARDRDIGRLVAIKQLRDDRRSRGAVLRFAEEVRTVGALDHPNIVPVHDVGVDAAGSPYFVMKHVRGRTLADIIEALRTGDPEEHAHFTFSRRIEIFRKVLEAVGFAHERGVIHRDLKPENIMVGTHGEVHVLDWGIAQRRGAVELAGDDEGEARVTETRAGQVMGTPAYMSPEQARGEAVDARSDIYSLGVVLHELLGLQHYLHDVSGLDEMLKAVQERSAPRLGLRRVAGQHAVPPQYSWLANDALAKSADQRIGSVAEWLERLDGLAEGDVPVQCPFTLQRHWVGKLTQAADRHPFLLAGLLVAGTGGGLALVGGAVVLAFVAGVVLI
jgi:serine/threonine-protein kinase